ncbi:hypothetical protein F4677DRAFT_326320 [Hypoxylon crocopeplum]|nr:hypothetical protein F4677DRAFT_326320 [Hypoxylon crocopeplum]
MAQSSAEKKMEMPQTPDSKSRPAVKDPSRYRWRRSASQTSSTHTAATTLRYSTNVKTPVPARLHSSLKAPDASTKAVKANVTNSAATKGSHIPAPRIGRPDPYDIQSESDANDPPTRKSTSFPNGRKTTLSSGQMSAGSSAPSKYRKSTLPSAPARVVAEPSTLTAASKGTRSLGDSHHPHRRAPARIPADAIIIPVDSSPDEDISARTPRQSTVISLDDSSSKGSASASAPAAPSHRRSVSSSESSVGASRNLQTGLDDGAASARGKHKGRKKLKKEVQVENSGQEKSFSKLEHRNTTPGHVEEGKGSTNTAIEQEVIAPGQRPSRDKTQHSNTSYHDRTLIPPSKGASNQSRAFPKPCDPKREPAQPKPNRPKAGNRSSSVSKTRGSSTAAMDGVKKNARKVRFDTNGNNPMPTSSFEQPRNSSDEYQPPTNNEKQASSDSDSDLPLSRRSRVASLLRGDNTLSLEPSPGGALRSRPLPKPATSVIPKKNAKGDARLPKSEDAIDEDSSGSGSRDEIKEDVVAVQPMEPEKTRWTPLEWIAKYETNFQGDGMKMWFADGPFKGWIWQGDEAGGYMPGCSAPDNQILVEAEKTAPPREGWQDKDWFSGAESEYEDDPEHALSDAGVAEQTECMKRTKHSNTGEQSSSLALTTAPENTSSPPSTSSESTSILITKQLINDCAPPSNQELAELMNFSPATKRDRNLPSVQKDDQRADSDDGYHSSSSGNSSSEPSSGIPARIRPKPPPHTPAKTQSPDTSFRFEHPSALYIMNGIAEKGTTRSLTERSPPVIGSDRQLRSAGRVGRDANHESPVPFGDNLTKSVPRHSNAGKTRSVLKDGKNRPSPKTNIVVELPSLTAEKLAEYSAISPAQRVDNISTPPPKSFKEINEATSSSDPQLDDPDAETLSYVLRQSPTWLNNITEVGEADDAATNRARSSSILLAKVPTKGKLALADASKPIAPLPASTSANGTLPRSPEVQPSPARSWYRLTEEQQTGTVQTRRDVGGQQQERSQLGTSLTDMDNAGEQFPGGKDRQKRKAPLTDVSVTNESAASKRQRTSDLQVRKTKPRSRRDENQMHHMKKQQSNAETRPAIHTNAAVLTSTNEASKSTALSGRRRRNQRRRKRLKQRRNISIDSTNPLTSKKVNVLTDANGSDKSTITPPTTSRPASSEVDTS